MKKIFTLIAAAFLAVGAQAQGSFRVQEGDTFTSEQQITSVPNITVVMGKDTWTAATKMDDKIEGYFAYTTGSANPTDANGKKPGNSAFDATTAIGCVVHFKPTIDGHLVIGAKQNKGDTKPLYLFEGAQTEVAKNPGQTDSQYIIIEADVTAGNNYCLYQGATKLGFFGFDFTAGPPVTTETVVMDAATTEEKEALAYERTSTDGNVKAAVAHVNKFDSEKGVNMKGGSTLTVSSPAGSSITKVAIAIGGSSSASKSYWMVDGNKLSNSSYVFKNETQEWTFSSNKDELTFSAGNDDTSDFNFYVTGVSVSYKTASGIEKTMFVQPKSNATFNLAGQQVNDGYKGVVIKGGKKVIQK